MGLLALQIALTVRFAPHQISDLPKLRNPQSPPPPATTTNFLVGNHQIIGSGEHDPREEITPLVMVLRTPLLEAACEKKHGVSRPIALPLHPLLSN
ncbi:hypothetical protein AKJ16_DCAP06237 [Drosera capensis]